ncbi:hypothetical protein Hdeb2414_s0018g00520461 [Helianthus debilis subsp. tardiflorus]
MTRSTRSKSVNARLRTSFRSVKLFKLRNDWNRRTHGIRVLSGVHFLEVLAYLLPLCNEDTIWITPDSNVIELTRCDRLVSEL